MFKKKRTPQGYPIPPKRERRVIWINSTPHLSKLTALEHKRILEMGRLDYPEFVSRLVDYLHPLLSDKQLTWLNEWASYARISASHLATKFHQSWASDVGSASHMVEKLLENVDEAYIRPELESTYVADTDKLWQLVESSTPGPLRAYEEHLFLKYAGDSSRRSAAGYTAQIKLNYLPGRPHWRSLDLPNRNRYDRALQLYSSIIGLEPSMDGNVEIEPLKGYLSRARTTTFGGYPYLRNMGDFVNDAPDDTTYADLYNRLALGYLLLAPRYKVAFNMEFIALERVQPGGVSVYPPGPKDVKANKQRFVQAQSAVISHAYKLIVDAVNNLMRRVRPTMSADKFGEGSVSMEMKRLASIAYGHEQLTPDDRSVEYNIVGTDYSNFDASQDVCISNDCHYMTWRRIMPAWMCYWIIDPYIWITYRDARIVTPKWGLVQTTGVKSGMCDTNQCDTQNCMLADIYELCYYSDTCRKLSDNTIRRLLQYTMDNGDDRFKLTYCSAEQIEQADAELGYIAQKSKQEVCPVGSAASQLNVTYLKTILFLDTNNVLVRTDAVAKLILGRMHPEHKLPFPMPYSLVVDFFMSAARSTESPNLWWLVEYMYSRLPVFRDLINGKESFESILDHMVAEQYELLKLRKGIKWMKRKGLDYDAVIEMVNVKHGYGDEGYRGRAGMLTKSGFAALPQVQAIMALAYARRSAGVLGTVFHKED